MRKSTVRSGLRFMGFGIACVIVATFFQEQVSRLLFLGLAGEASLTFLGFFLGGMCGGFGVLIAAAGLLQSAAPGSRVRLAPTVLMLISLIVLFFVLAYHSLTTPSVPRLQPGESISI